MYLKLRTKNKNNPDYEEDIIVNMTTVAQIWPDKSGGSLIYFTYNNEWLNVHGNLKQYNVLLNN